MVGLVSVWALGVRWVAVHARTAFPFHIHVTPIPTDPSTTTPTNNGRTTNDALDAELVADASHECLLRLAVVVTGFDKAAPKATRTLYSACGKGGGK